MLVGFPRYLKDAKRIINYSNGNNEVTFFLNMKFLSKT